MHLICVRNAYGIVILKYNDERPLFIDSVNELFVSTCFDTCEKEKIDIIAVSYTHLTLPTKA